MLNVCAGQACIASKRWKSQYLLDLVLLSDFIPWILS